MLETLTIKNYALIDEIHIEFGANFNTITGETGAGKSILLGALGLVLGNRADTQSLKNPQKKCVIETQFRIINTPLIKQILDEEDIDFENPCILRREISPSGKSRAFVNDTPVSIQLLKKLKTNLIDIHSQHQNLMLNNEYFALQIVDTFAQNNSLLLEYLQTFDDYKKIISQKNKLLQQAQKARQNYDIIKFQFDEINHLNLKPDEETELLDEISRLTHSDEIQTHLATSVNLLDANETNVLSLLAEINLAIGTLAKFWNPAHEIHNRINSAYIDLKDIAAELNQLAENIEADPDRLDALNARSNQIERLKLKHKAETIELLLNVKNELEKELNINENLDEQLDALTDKENQYLHQLEQQAHLISQKRQETAPFIQHQIQQSLSELGMPSARFQIAFTTTNEFTQNGTDAIQFLFSANKQIPPQPIDKVASGGEISRFMLALKALVAQKMELPAIVFDEIDTGISGDIADKMGDIMKKMAQKMQVISITHLPQVAVKGQTHFKVYKRETETTTSSHIKALTQNERIEEIAKMLSGASLTEAAIDNAKQLLKLS